MTPPTILFVIEAKIIRVGNQQIQNAQKEEPSPIGKLFASSIDLNVNVYSSTDEYHLHYGVGKLGGTSEFGENGIAVIAGMPTNEQFFRLEDLIEEDLIELIYNDRKYTYHVTSKGEVAENDIGTLLTENSDSKLMLITTDTNSLLRVYVICNLSSSEDHEKQGT